MEPRVKIALLGEYGVGKTRIRSRFVEGIFSHDQSCHLWGRFGKKKINFNDSLINIEIWDTAGEERYNSYRFSYLKAVDGLVLVYKVSSRGSYEGISKILGHLIRSDINKPTILVGTKIDLENREVSYQEAQKFAESKGFLFNEICSETNENINESIISLAKRILKIE